MIRGREERDQLQNRLEAANREIARLQSQLMQQSQMDPVTGLIKETPFMNAVTNELARAGRYGRPVVAARIDIDNFEAVNVQHGRAAGDRALAAAAQAIISQIRAQDTLCRGSGDQFALLLPETDAAGGVQCLERVLGVLERLKADGIEG